MNNCFTTENSEAKLCYSHKLLFQNEEGLRCSPTNLSLSPKILPVGSWQLSKAFPEKGSPPGRGHLSGRLGSSVLGVHECVRECVCDLFGEGSNNWFQAGSLCGQRLLSKQKPLKGNEEPLLPHPRRRK